MNHFKKTGKGRRLLCLLLAALLITAAMLPGLSVYAATTPTSLGFAEHGIKAHRDGWKYVSGAKGQKNSSGVRTSDCAGLVYAYFSDCGAIGDCKGGATSQVTSNCVFSNDISEGIPKIHGLALTMPDYYDPGTGIYGHIGIYIGNNEATDNSDTEYNMRRETVIGSGRNWNAWHIFDNGMRYPVNGWYALDGRMVYYVNYEYVTNTYVDGYQIGSDGYALKPDGTGALEVKSDMLSTQYASATEVANYLRTRYSGVDSTYELIYGSGDPGDDPAPTVVYNGKVTASSVNLRAAASTKSNVVTVLSRGAEVDLWEEVTGEKITNAGKTSDKWYSVITPSGSIGYICSLFIERSGALSGAAPEITAENGYVTIGASPTSNVFYTIDGTTPDMGSIPYTTPIFQTGYTYKAIAYNNGRTSPVSTATVLSDSSVFTDFKASDWFFSAVDKAVGFGIFHGKGNGIFDPNKEITRAEFVTALANLMGAGLDNYTANSPFTDVTNYSSTMHRAILWAHAQGYVSGYSDNTFRPNEVIQREQMCVILAKAANLVKEEDSAVFADDARISSWAKDAVYACRDRGLISGVGNNRFDPRATASRAQACVVTGKLYELLQNTELPPPAADDTQNEGGVIIF